MTAAEGPIGPRYSVRLLGCFELADGAVRQLPSSAQRLVALLCLEGARPRRQVAGILWPDTTEAAGLANLRTVLWRLGRAAPGLVRGSTTSVRLAEASSDVALLERAVIDVAAPEEPATTARAMITSGSTEIVPDWPDEWIAQHRTRVRVLWLDLADVTVDRLLAAGQNQLALHLASLAVSIDPLRETAHARVIRAHLAQGNRVAAQRVYDQLREQLAVELGVMPDRSLKMLLDRGLHPLPTDLISGDGPARPDGSGMHRTFVARGPDRRRSAR